MTNAPQYQSGQQPAALPADYPGKTLGLVGLILAIVVPLVGLILSIVAQNQSKAAGYPNQLAKIGVIIGAILLVLGIIGSILYFVTVGSMMSTAGY
ncbi:MAG TPA: hypothetical protein VNJ54_18335 [Plantibacter sp.]|uniref:hypothetical protein n=1 Tax=unclassified Plantibacter TaxID=2624265 RepID=UPI002B5CDF59|nr:hypothetical protein [Plantibacter sp.]